MTSWWYSLYQEYTKVGKYYLLNYAIHELKTRSKSQQFNFIISRDSFIRATANKQIFQYGAVDPESMVWPDGYKDADR